MGVIDMSTSELARRARTSPSTVVRCCQRMGFAGLRRLRLAVAREVREEVLHHEGIADDDSEPTILAKVFASAARALAEGTATIDPTAFKQAVAAVCDARRVLFVGGARRLRSPKMPPTALQRSASRATHPRTSMFTTSPPGC